MMGFGSSGIETTRDGHMEDDEGVQQWWMAGCRDRQTQAEIQPSTTTYHAQKGEQRRKMKRRERKKSAEMREREKKKKKKKGLNRGVRNIFLFGGEELKSAQ
jgi:hypothetical protein